MTNLTFLVHLFSCVYRSYKIVSQSIQVSGISNSFTQSVAAFQYKVGVAMLEFLACPCQFQLLSIQCSTCHPSTIFTSAAASSSAASVC
jgi:hypothetical protein